MTNKIYYKDEEHKNKLKELLIKYNKVYAQCNNEVDQYYLPIFYIFTANEELKRKCFDYITSEGIMFNKMKEEQNFSSSASILIKLAHQLFNEGETTNIMDIVGILDGENFRIAIQAIILRRSPYKYKDV